MRVPLLASSLLAVAHAQFIILNDFSFGHDGRISTDRSRTVPNFDLLGEPRLPEILSNKVVLTPAAPAPGNQRGAIWAQKPLDKTQWMVDIDMRVSGSERGGGNVNIWLARDGPQVVGTSSVYTANRFEGLVLTLDTTGSASKAGGSLRGYLNDGTREFKSLTGIDSLAFGRCDFAYRNLGRPSRIKIRQTDRIFEVEIDGASCFASEQVVIPEGYRFGITAASADIPDSAEIFKFVVLTDQFEKQQQQQPPQGQQQQQQQPPQEQQQQQQQQQQQAANTQTDAQDGSDLADMDAELFVTSEAQFKDLHNRIQGLSHQQSSVIRQVSQLQRAGDKQHSEVTSQLGQLDQLNQLGQLGQLGEIKGLLGEVKSRLDRLDRIEQVQKKLDQMERDMKSLHSELRKSLSRTEQSLKGRLANHHDTLASELRHPGYQRLILVIIGGQIFLVVSFFVYKRRKANSPKKYL